MQPMRGSDPLQDRCWAKPDDVLFWHSTLPHSVEQAAYLRWVRVVLDRVQGAALFAVCVEMSLVDDRMSLRK